MYNNLCYFVPKYNKRELIMSFKNIVVSFFLSAVVTVVLAYIMRMTTSTIADEKLVEIIYKGVFLVSAVIISQVARVYNTGKYRKSANPIVLGFITYIILPIGVWATAYQILQIKDGNVRLKP